MIAHKRTWTHCVALGRSRGRGNGGTSCLHPNNGTVTGRVQTHLQPADPKVNHGKPHGHRLQYRNALRFAGGGNVRRHEHVHARQRRGDGASGNEAAPVSAAAARGGPIRMRSGAVRHRVPAAEVAGRSPCRLFGPRSVCTCAAFGPTITA